LLTNSLLIFPVFEDGLPKAAVATMAEGNISTSDLPLYFWMVYLIFLMKKLVMVIETDRDKGIISDQYSDASDDKSYSMTPEEMLSNVNAIQYSSFYLLIIVLS